MTGFEAEWRARFERYARSSEDEAFISGWSTLGLQRRFELFRSVIESIDLSSEATALDLGCGAGTYVRWLAGRGHGAIGVDYSGPTLARAVAADPGGKGRYLAADGYALPFREGVFELVVSIGVLQAVGHPERAIAEMARVLRPGGTVVLEGLNARAVTARAADRVRRLRGAPERVRTYEPSAMRGWLEASGLHDVREVPVHLPPRRWPRLARLLDSAPVRSSLAGSPALGKLLTHSYLFVASRA